MRQFLSSKKGFTLLEMLVVIGIIIIIIGLGAASYSTAQKKARDTRRESDLKQIQNAMEQYYAICGTKYRTFANGGISGALTCTDNGITVMSAIPVDPLSGNYTCTNCTVDGYTICPARMETKTCTGTSCCVTNLQ